MKIKEDFIRDNDRIEIISSDGVATSFPEEWKPVLGNCNMMVAIPDMHMYIHDNSTDNFNFGAEAMISFLNHIKKIKDSFEDNDKLLRVYQLGDMYELRFPGEFGNAIVPEILLSHNDYSNINRLFCNLYVNRIYGNHDFENRHGGNYEFSYEEGKIHMEHGFAGDNWTSNTADPLWELGALGLKTCRYLNDFFNNLEMDSSDVNKDKPPQWFTTSGQDERIVMPTEDEYLEDNESIKKYYCDRLKNKKNGSGCRISIIGHTHSPHLDANVGDGKYLYIDAGGWVEGRSDFVVATDEEIAICHYKRV